MTWFITVSSRQQSLVKTIRSFLAQKRGWHFLSTFSLIFYLQFWIWQFQNPILTSLMGRIVGLLKKKIVEYQFNAQFPLCFNRFWTDYYQLHICNPIFYLFLNVMTKIKTKKSEREISIPLYACVACIKIFLFLLTYIYT